MALGLVILRNDVHLGGDDSSFFEVSSPRPVCLVMAVGTETTMIPPSIEDALGNPSLEASTLSVYEAQEVQVVMVVMAVMGACATAQNLVRHVVHLEVRNQQL